MKKLILLVAITALWVFPVRAGHVIDSANILGYQDTQLNQSIESIPVFIETYENIFNIRSFADNRVKDLTSRGFIIVVTTNPRAWRISMTPERITSGESTRIIGDEMASHFKRGDFYNGLNGAAHSLNKLLVSGNVESSIPIMAKNGKWTTTNPNITRPVSATMTFLPMVD